MEKVIMQGTMPGARRRGRPRTAWMDNIKAWTGLSVGRVSQNDRGSSLRQTVHTHCASVQQAAKLVAALHVLRVAWRKVMAAYRRVYDSHHLQADCQEPGSAPEPYAR